MHNINNTTSFVTMLVTRSGVGNELLTSLRWAEFRQLCAMLGVRPQLLDISASVRDLYRVVISCLREQSQSLLPTAVDARPSGLRR